MSEQTLRITIKSFFLPAQRVKVLKPGEYYVGRDVSCDIVIPDPYVSRRHLRIFFDSGRWFIEDLGSTNGTFINGEDIRGRGAIELKPGMEIVLGLSVIIVEALGSESRQT